MSRENKNDVPPYCNTGVQNTHESGLKAVVDWVEGTSKTNDIEHVIGNVLMLSREDFIDMAKGMHGYRSGLRFADIQILYDGTEEMGIHYILSGQACRQYEYVMSPTKESLIRLLERGRELENKLSRLDLAVDDFKGYFSIPGLVKLIKKGQLVSKFKKARNIEDILITDGSTKGTTLYFGSSKSDIMIRMYEKNYEMEKEDEIPVWNRIEIQLRNDRATKAADMIIGGMDVGEVVLGVLNQYIRFIKPYSGKNKSRAETHPKWKAFIGDVGKLRLSDQPEPPDFNRKKEWLIDKVAKTLFMVDKIDDEVWNRVHLKMLEAGEKKMKPRDWLAIESEIQKRELDKEEAKFQDYLRHRYWYECSECGCDLTDENRNPGLNPEEPYKLCDGCYESFVVDFLRNNEDVPPGA